MNIILVDDHSLFRRGLRSLLERNNEYKVIAEASSGEEFLAMEELHSADIVFMDISMEGMAGDVATERAITLRPDIKIITLSMFGDQSYYQRMVEAGAKGFLLKDSDIQEVESAIEAVYNGGNYFSESLLESLTTYMRSSESAQQDSALLSSRETEILIAVCQGLSNHEIADKLFISKRTVDKHRANIMEKTNCRNTANLVVYAVKNNLVDL